MRRAGRPHEAGRARRSTARTGGERGAVAALVAVLLVVLIGFVALVVDIGRLYRARDELQNASDAAALAAAQMLDRTAPGLTRARAAAHDFAARHQALGHTVTLVDADITFGHWDEATEVFTPLAETAPGAINAARVVTRRSAALGDPVVLLFARVLGRDLEDVSATAIAIGGGPLAECAFPMVVPDCALDDPISEGTCDYCMQYQDNNTDNAGWTAFGAGSLGGKEIADIIRAGCFAADGSVAIDPETRECAGTCLKTHAGDEIKVNNGNLMNIGTQNFCPVIQTLLTRGVAGAPAQPFVVRVPVLASQSSGCDAAQFSSYKVIAGYAAMEIFGAKCGHADPGVIAPSGPCTPPSSEKYLVAALRCDLDSGEGTAGGAYYGIDALHTRLVR